MDRELRLLVAENSIRRVLLTYCRGVDRMDLELIRSVFHPEAIDEHSARYSGPGIGFADYIAQSLPAQNLLSTTHHITNMLIKFVSEDRASAETYFWPPTPMVPTSCGCSVGTWMCSSNERAIGRFCIAGWCTT